MFDIVLAVDNNFGIGNTDSNGLAWNISEDLQHFKKITTDDDKLNIIVMGRKTADTLKKPLPNRKTTIITICFSMRRPQGMYSG